MNTHGKNRRSILVVLMMITMMSLSCLNPLGSIAAEMTATPTAVVATTVSPTAEASVEPSEPAEETPAPTAEASVEPEPAQETSSPTAETSVEPSEPAEETPAPTEEVTVEPSEPTQETPAPTAEASVEPSEPAEETPEPTEEVTVEPSEPAEETPAPTAEASVEPSEPAEETPEPSAEPSETPAAEEDTRSELQRAVEDQGGAYVNVPATTLYATQSLVSRKVEISGGVALAEQYISSQPGVLQLCLYTSEGNTERGYIRADEVTLICGAAEENPPKLTAMTCAPVETETPEPSATPAPQTRSITVSVSWQNDDASSRPGQVEVFLMADGEPVSNAILNEACAWSVTFEAPIYQADGVTPIVYSVQQEALEDYDTEYAKQASAARNRLFSRGYAIIASGLAATDVAAQPPATAPESFVITNTAKEAENPPDASPANASSTPSLSITGLQSMSGSCNPDFTFTYRLKIRNYGTDILNNVFVSFALSNGSYEFYRCDKGFYDSAAQTWNITSIFPGETLTLYYDARANSTLVNGDFVRLTTTIVSTDGVATDALPEYTASEQVPFVEDHSDDYDHGFSIPSKVYEGDVFHSNFAVGTYSGAKTGVKRYITTDSTLTEIVDVFTSKGNFSLASHIWDVGDLAAGESAYLVIYQRAKDGTGGLMTITGDTRIAENGYTYPIPTGLNIENGGGTDILSKLSVFYDANAAGASGSVTDPLEYRENDDVTALDNNYTYPMHVFKGWNTDPDGYGAAYAPGDVFEIDADTTLYAQWAFDTSNLSIAKTADKSVVMAGETVTYTITATNHSTETITANVLKDAAPACLTFVSADYPSDVIFYPNTINWRIENLPAGESRTVELTYRVNDYPDGLDNGDMIVNTASWKRVNGEKLAEEDWLNANASVRLDAPNIVLTKSIYYKPDEISSTYINDDFTFEVRAERVDSLSLPAVDIEFAEFLPSNTTFIDAVADAGSSYDTASHIWTIDSMQPGDVHLLYVTVHPRSTVQVGDEITNYAGTLSMNGITEVDGKPWYYQMAGASGWAIVPRVTIEKTTDVSSVQPGDEITYTVTVKNDYALLDTITVGEDYSDNLTYVRSSATNGAYDPGTKVWSMDSLQTDDTTCIQYAALTITFKVADTAQEGDTVTNTATVLTAHDLPITDAAAQVMTPVVQPKLAIEKSMYGLSNGDTVSSSGGNLTYFVVVTNQGTGTARNCEIKDPIPTYTTFVKGSVSNGATVGLTDEGGVKIAVCQIDALAPGDSVTLSLTVNIATMTVTGSRAISNAAGLIDAKGSSLTSNMVWVIQTNVSNGSSVPKTGDDSGGTVALIWLASIGLAGSLIALFKHRKKQPAAKR